MAVIEKNEFKKRETVVSTMYTFSMKIVYIKIRNTEKPAKVTGDAVTEEDASKLGGKVTITLEGQKVGSFKVDAVEGWWIEEE